MALHILYDAQNTPELVDSRTLRVVGIHEHELAPIFQKYTAVKLRYYDVEALTACLSDVAVWETSNLQKYHFLIDALRDAKFGRHFFEVIDIMPAISYIEYDDAQGFIATQETGARYVKATKP